ncbi:MAG: D-sedoheptulose 7-phosphate isomerase [Candidatus Omnitrophica bacterium]|nr:D-sedoheptulose 7-phosphate isomerase [Candidatus Omnitrophota bacterium]MBU4487774.1 D-sedoheptulose 7-phosphate isomerase [Candidatus Omnitrophota bacterium]MCG2705184.1 D-sedoheptulose 7-phosphate isomerase [Candidatus Omnitrophota bacterium]
MKKNIEEIINSSIEVKKRLLEKELSNLEKTVSVIVDCISRGGKILLFGNGGSAADSQHIAAEFVGRFRAERRALPAVALTTNTSILTALSNDYGYDISFKRQIEALGNKNDVAIAISTSGNAKNVIEAVKEAKQKGVKTIALTGKGGGALAKLCDVVIIVASNDTARIQETHILIGHIIAQLVEEAFTDKDDAKK